MLRDDEETKKSKIHLFWLVYAAEKGLALRLGRPSIIRDGDITVTDDLHVLSFPGLWPEILDFWVENARVQGQIYGLLYSDAAVSDPQNDISVSAELLLDKMKSIGSRTPYVRDIRPIVAMWLTINYCSYLEHEVQRPEDRAWKRCWHYLTE